MGSDDVERTSTADDRQSDEWMPERDIERLIAEAGLPIAFASTKGRERRGGSHEAAPTASGMADEAIAWHSTQTGAREVGGFHCH
jgi:hypothetical protein